MVPSGYVQIPLWVLTSVVASLLGLIGYIWHRADRRMDRLELTLDGKVASDAINARQISLNTVRLDRLESSEVLQLREGKVLTVEAHDKECTIKMHTIMSDLANMIERRMGERERWMELKFAALSEKIDYMTRPDDKADRAVT